MIFFSTGPSTGTLFVTAFLTSGHQNPSPKHGDRRSRLHFIVFWFWIVRYIWSNWIFLSTEQNRNRQSLWATRSFEFLFRESQTWQWSRHHGYEGMRLGSYLGNYGVLNIRLRMETFLEKSSCNYSRLYAFVCPSVLVSLGKCRRRFCVVMECNLVLCHRSTVQQRGAIGFAMGMALHVVTPLAFYPHLQNRTRTISWEHNPMPAAVSTFVTPGWGVPQKHRILF